MLKTSFLILLATLLWVPTQSAIAQQLDTQQFSDGLLKPARRITKTCDVNNVWGFWDLSTGKGRKMLTVRGTYYICKANCDCGGYFCTTAKGIKYGVATQCEGITF